jgi:hypothetical protein
MMWYAAHVIMYVVFKDGQQGNYTVWENVFLVEGTDDRVALKKAEDLGRNAEGDANGSMKWQGRPASWAFAGVRKVVKCDSDRDPPHDGTELTYSEFLVDNMNVLRELAGGRRVRIDDYD